MTRKTNLQRSRIKNSSLVFRCIKNLKLLLIKIPYYLTRKYITLQFLYRLQKTFTFMFVGIFKTFNTWSGLFQLGHFQNQQWFMKNNAIQVFYKSQVFQSFLFSSNSSLFVTVCMRILWIKKRFNMIGNVKNLLEKIEWNLEILQVFRLFNNTREKSISLHQNITKSSTNGKIYRIFKTISHPSAKCYLIPCFDYNFYLQKFATLKFDMEDNDILINKLNQNPYIRPQKCRKTQSGSLQNHSGENFKNYNIANSDESLNLAKKQEDYFLIPERTNSAKLENLHGIEIAAVKQKKQPKSQTNNVYPSEAKSTIQNMGNCKKQDASSHKKQIVLNGFSTSGFKLPSNKSYNNLGQEQISNQINFIQRQRRNQKKSKKFVQKPSQIPGQRLIQSLQKHRMSMFVKDGEILFPIPDHILKPTQKEQSSTDTINSIKPHLLPKGFCYLLEMMSISYLFPQLFKFDQETISKISHILQASLEQKNSQQNQIQAEKPLNLILEEVFKAYIKTAASFMIQDLSSDKLQSLGPSHTFDILSLAKFQFIFRYNWPLITLELVNLSTEQPHVIYFLRFKCQNTQFTKSIKFIQNCVLNGNFEMPSNFELRLQLISLLVDKFSKTSSFRELLNKKLETNRNLNKKRIELEQEKKNVEQAIKKINALKIKKSKKITKTEKKKNRPTCQVSENEEKDSKNLEQLQKLQKNLDEISLQIQKQNRQDSLSCVHFLGKDSKGHLYWYVSYFPNKLYIQKQNQNWYFLCIDQTFNFIDSLDRRGINQNRLYERIQQYYRHPLYKHQSKMEIETQQNNVNQKPSNSSFQIFQTNLVQKKNLTIENRQMDLQKFEAHEQENQYDSSKNSTDNNELLIGLGGFKLDKDSLIRMVEVGEKKMTEYLKERNSRWGSEQNRQSLFETIKGSQLNWLEESKRQISLFNQKICVVEIQYKVFVQHLWNKLTLKLKKFKQKYGALIKSINITGMNLLVLVRILQNCSLLCLFFYSLIKKYTSKHRKLRKEYEQIKQKTAWKTTSAVKQWTQNWNQICQVCGQNGQLLCCDFCPKVYHLDCLNLSQIPSNQYKCKSCKQQITTRNQLKNWTKEGKGKERNDKFNQIKNFNPFQCLHYFLKL